MSFFFTSESVSEGHPDKIADQISDALLDNFLAFDPYSKVACETLVTTGQVVLAGEVRSEAYLDVPKIARDVINKIGYTKGEYQFSGDSCGVISLIHEQSPDITQGVDRGGDNQGAGDQGIMFGYATDETNNYMPLPLEIAHTILMVLAQVRRQGDAIGYLRPDAKAQVTLQYSDDFKAERIDTIVISTQHDPFATDEVMHKQIYHDLTTIVMPQVIEKFPEHIRSLFKGDIKYLINPTGKFVIGGPHGDTGLTGRKIIIDTYGGKGYHGGGAFSGKDPSKVDRSAAYAARHIAKNLVAAGAASEATVQLSYAIGIAEPTSVFVSTKGNKTKFSDTQIASKMQELFDLRPAIIERRLNLRAPIYLETAAYGHMGRSPETVQKTFESAYSGTVQKQIELFSWEKLDYVAEISTLLKL